MNLFIITGTTKGLGHSLANKAIEQGHLVLSLSRKKSIQHKNFYHITHDLSKNTTLVKKLHKSLEELPLKRIKTIHLINNAAAINPIGHITNFKASEINQHMQINLIAPIILTSAVLDFFKRKNVPKIFTTISSGAALRPIPNWSLYCSSKSALLMFTDCMSTDMDKNLSVKFLDFSPGVMDTDMQLTIRNSSTKNFGKVKDFIELKEKNLLLPTDKVADELMKLLRFPEKISKNHYDIREFI